MRKASVKYMKRSCLQNHKYGQIKTRFNKEMEGNKATCCTPEETLLWSQVQWKLGE